MVFIFQFQLIPFGEQKYMQTYSPLSSNMLKLLSLILTVSIAHAAKVTTTNPDTLDNHDFNDTDEITCDPQIADSCFSDVNADLHWIFQPKNGYQQAHNLTILRDLCSAWADSLDCTSSIIDTDCADASGRGTFDRWNAAFTGGLKWLCEENDLENIQSIFATVDCFNFPLFMECTEKTAGLTSIEDLMKIKIDYQECTYLHQVLYECASYATNNYTVEDNEAKLESKCKHFLDPIVHLLQVFIKTAECEKPIASSQGPSRLLAVEAKFLTAIIFLYKLHFL